MMKPAYFRVTDHTARKTQVVEVLNGDGKLIATIYPHDHGLHIVSKHLGTALSMVSCSIPSVLVTLTEEGRW